MVWPVSHSSLSVVTHFYSSASLIFPHLEIWFCPVENSNLSPGFINDIPLLSLVALRVVLLGTSVPVVQFYSDGRLKKLSYLILSETFFQSYPPLIAPYLNSSSVYYAYWGRLWILHGILVSLFQGCFPLFTGRKAGLGIGTNATTHVR